MTNKEASDYLLARHSIKRTPGTLAKLRVIGGGPAFRKANRNVVYAATDLDAWAAEITSGLLRSTSEQGAAS